MSHISFLAKWTKGFLIGREPCAITLSITALISLTLISCIDIAPIAGNTSVSKYLNTRAAWFSFQRCRLSVCHRRAIDSKVFRAAACRSRFSCCLASLGSCPDTSKRRAFSAAWRASTSDTVGYLPIESVLRLPLCEKSNRHNFPPLVLIYRYKPLPSFSLNGFSAGLAFLICRSFSLCRSEERRVGKECRSRWSPYH